MTFEAKVIRQPDTSKGRAIKIVDSNNYFNWAKEDQNESQTKGNLNNHGEKLFLFSYKENPTTYSTLERKLN